MPPSVRRYVIPERDSIAAMVFTRRETGWEAGALTAGETLALPETDASLPLVDVYADAGIPPPGNNASA